jgi:hypothetical protein
MINGLPVTSIGFYVFDDCTSLTSVTIPNTVTDIGVGAFIYCNNLTNLTLGNSVASIGYNAFSYCTSLTNVTIPKSVTHMDGSEFDGCSSLVEIVVDASNPSYSSVEGVLFDKSLRTLFEYPGGKTGSYAVPTSVTNINRRAFVLCSSLSSVTVPNGVIGIGTEAFMGCSSLTSATIPNSVTSIGDWVFDGCLHLASVTIPNSITRIGDGAFEWCYSLMGVYFQGNAPSLGSSYVFMSDDHATVYYLPGTSGWGSTFGGRPTALWFLPNPLILNGSVGLRTSRFGFTISWATNASVVVEASTSLTTPTWSRVSTSSLSGGSSYFSDLQWTNYPGRFYRIHSP